MMKIKIEPVGDFQDIDIILNDDGNDMQVIWADEQPLDLDMCIRYGTPWVSKAPNFEDLQGNRVSISGFYGDMYMPYFIEINEADQTMRVWKEVK